MSEAHSQDERTWQDHDRGDAVAPPAPANQWTPHDGGIEPAAPGPDSTARAISRLFDSLRRWTRRGR